MRLYERTDGTIAGTQADAGKGFTQIEVPTTKAELIEYLNNNRHIPCDCAEAAPAPAPKPEGYVEKSVRFEDEFDAMPLATQLHYATKALENARDKL